MFGHTQPALDHADVKGLDWRQDPQYHDISTRRDATQRRLRELPAALAEAEQTLADARAVLEEQELFWLVQKTEAKTLDAARQAHTRAQEAYRRLQAEELVAREALTRFEAAVLLVAHEARERVAAQLRQLFAETASEFAELLPAFLALHERLRAIYNQAQTNFPMILHRHKPGAWRAELLDGMPQGAGLPWLMIRELFLTPQGSRLQRLQDDIERYLEAQP